MKALVLEAPGRLAYKDVPKPEIDRDEVLVAVKACGICGSDVHGMDGSTGRRRPPIIMGHEAAGVIAEVGPELRGWAPGDRVTFDSTIWCGTCPFCRAGRINLCDNRRVLGVSCEAYRRHGAFAEYVAVPARVLVRLPEGLSFARAALVEPLSVAVHAVGRLAVSLDDTAVVVGAGIIGLLAVQVLRAAGCGTIIAVDCREDRMAKARALGADEAIRARDGDVVEAVRARTGGRGADVAVEAVGTAPAVGTAIGCLRKGGAVALVGNISPAVEIPLQDVVTREIALHGSCASCGEYPACLERIARGAVDVDALIGARAPLAEGAAWFARLAEGGSGLLKVILEP